MDKILVSSMARDSKVTSNRKRLNSFIYCVCVCVCEIGVKL